jgi:ABC-type lipoprotein export system ATPase subunit
MVFQTFNLLHGFTAIENVMLAMMFSGIPPREHRPRAAELLARLGLTPLQHDRAAERLSIGQQQRVAVARALACKPALVLADEPTASLDPENSAAAVDLLKSACQGAGAALLCVSHDPALPAQFPRHVAMRDISAPQPPAAVAGGVH